MSEIVKHSKFLSLILRHSPETIGLRLDSQGWADVDELLRLAQAAGKRLSLPLLQRVVAENDKRRFSFSDDGRRIRANQGHSLDVDLALTPSVPPDMLYHGTATRFLDSIRAQGLLPGSRQHVHLSIEEATAIKVGARHGKPTVLIVRAAAMVAAGRLFWLSANGVWLTETVPVEYLEFPSEE